MNVNIPYEDYVRPTLGPENPFGDRKFLNQNTLAGIVSSLVLMELISLTPPLGHVEEQAMSDFSFKSQHLSHAILGYDGTTRPPNEKRKELKRKRKDKGDLEVVDGDGAYVGPWAGWKEENESQLIPEGLDEEEEEDPAEKEKEEENRKIAKAKRSAFGQETSIFHGKSMTDYQGRTYMSPPLATAPQLLSESGLTESFIPKVCVHTFTGHTQGVSVIRSFPKTGHLLLSGSMDTKIKVLTSHTGAIESLC
jgi:pre-mRNA-processing factor 17